MPAELRPISLQARVVFPVDRAPIWDGCVKILGERIVAVGPAPAGSEVHDLGNVAILPGLVNAHTHLEFSHLPAPLGQRGTVFPEWIRQVVASRRQANADVDSIAAGLRESLNAGVTTLGEIASPGPWPAAFDRTPLEVTVFLELIGLSSSRSESKLTEAAEHLHRERDNAAHWTLGISPHAPYTVHPQLFARAIDLAASAAAPVAFHLAESREELELLRSATGPFRSLLEDLGAWDPTAIPLGTRPMDYLRMLSKAQRALVIHGNYFDEEEIDYIAIHADRMSVVYCPRTHDYFSHLPYPLAKMIASGVSVALGTDSRASSPDLSLLTEMRFAATRHSNALLSKILECGTLGGARALGRDQQTGSLTPNKLANLAVVPLPDRTAADPHELLFDSQFEATATYCRGELVTGKPD